MRERDVERYLVDRCRGHGFLCWKFVSPARAGVPDRIVVTAMRTVFVEVKRPGNTLRRLQKVTVARMREHGAEVHVVAGRDDVDELIARLKPEEYQ